MLGFICQILHIFHNVKIASSGEMNISDFTVFLTKKLSKYENVLFNDDHNLTTNYPTTMPLNFY